MGHPEGGGGDGAGRRRDPAAHFPQPQLRRRRKLLFPARSPALYELGRRFDDGVMKWKRLGGASAAPGSGRALAGRRSERHGWPQELEEKEGEERAAAAAPPPTPVTSCLLGGGDHWRGGEGASEASGALSARPGRSRGVRRRARREREEERRQVGAG